MLSEIKINGMQVFKDLQLMHIDQIDKIIMLLRPRSQD
jgi:hypothetical protein